MIVLRGGSFRMGDLIGDGQPYERPLHEVRVAPFALGRFELTNAEWKACVVAGSCPESHLPGDDHHGRYPVAGVTWVQAKAYTDWLAARTGKPYRLATEAEWEYAARAGKRGSYPWGPAVLDVCSQVNALDASGQRAHPDWYWAEHCDDHFSGAAPVGSFPPNAWGFHDMLGNVWEWVADCWHSDYTGAPADGAAWVSDACHKYVNRGGGWGNNLQALRLSSRDADPASAYSDGLGLRVARSVSAEELPAGENSTPDSHVAQTQNAYASWPLRAGSEKSPAPAAPVLTASTAQPLALSLSLATERQFEVHITVQGDQTWNNGLQHTHGTATQDYLLSTRLRSDGVLYGENLIDLDPTTRLRVKQQYLARRGLMRIKALNGGKLPHTAEELAALTAKVQSDMQGCMSQGACAGEGVERSAALGALENNPVGDLEALIAAPATGEAARWLYFFGYAGCPNRIHINSEVHIAGVRAYDHGHQHLVPWSLDRSAHTDGNAEDRADLCQRYTATVDVRSGDVYLENLYIPSPPGTTVRSINGGIERRDEELPVPGEVLTFTTDQLRRTRESLNISQALTANGPLDGDYSVLGHFDGSLQTTLAWSFKPVDGAPIAVIPQPAR